MKRQTFHALGALSIIAIIILGKWLSILFFTALVASIMISAEFRKRRAKLKKTPLFRLKVVDYVENHLHMMVKERERKNESSLNGVLMFYLGCLMVVVLFPPLIASISILILAICDSVSTVIGKMYGRHKLLFINRKKSWEGSMAFFIFCLIIVYLFMDPIKAITLAMAVTFVEMIPDLNDNITVPLSAGVLLYLFI